MLDRAQPRYGQRLRQAGHVPHAVDIGQFLVMVEGIEDRAASSLGIGSEKIVRKMMSAVTWVISKSICTSRPSATASSRCFMAMADCIISGKTSEMRAKSKAGIHHPPLSFPGLAVD